MPINFPDSPSVNDQYTVGDRTWTWNGTYWQTSTSMSTFTASDSEPVDADAGDIWFDSTIGKTFINYGGTWVEIGNAATVVDVIADADADTKVQVESSADEDKIRFSTAGTERVIVDNAGNVGIGISSPARSPLHLHTPSTAATELHLTNTESGSTSSDGLTLFYDDATNGAGLLMREAGPLKFGTSGSEKMRIDSSGNVGIGTGTPEYPLHASRADGTVLKLENTDTNRAPAIQMIGVRSDGLESRTLLNAGASGRFTIDVDPNDVGSDTESWFSVTVDGSESFRVDANSRTSISNIGGTTVDASENLNVFGTTSPSAKIVTTDDSGSSAYLTIGGARTSSSTSYLGRINFDNLSNQSTGGNYRAAEIEVLDPSGAYASQNGSMKLKVADGGSMETRIELDPNRTTIYGQATDAPLRIQSTDSLCTVDFIDSNTTVDSNVRVGAVGNDLVLYAGGSESLRIDVSENHFVLKAEAQGILFPNTESGDYTDAQGLLVFDLNFYNDTGYGTGTYQPAAAWTSDGGGLLINDQEGWGGIVSSTNMRWLNADFASLDAGSKAFKITHPVLGGDHKLRHSSVESPYIDNIYRGMATLDETGSAVVDLDSHFGMTAGTWVALNTNPWVMAQVKGGGAVDWELDGADLTLTGDPGGEARWLVMAERQDEAIMNTDRTDENGRLIVEFEQVTTAPVEEAN